MKNYFEEKIKTSRRLEMLLISDVVRDRIRVSGIREGICVIHVPHTTAGITINENADPNVVRDILFHIRQMVPNSPDFLHSEGNSDSHILSSLFSPSLTLIIHEGRPLLGTWQGIYFCEFDGPRQRRYQIKCMAG